MSKFCILTLILLCTAAPLGAADLGAPDLSAPLALPRLFDPDLFLTTAGVKYSASRQLTLEPELGVGHRAVQRDLGGGVEESSHRVHAQAGGRLSLAETVYLSAAAKLPVYTFEKAGSFSGQDVGSRQGYDLARSLKNPLAWTGEVGVHLSSWADLTLYYDQSSVPGWLTAGPQQEELIGTRLIWRFK